MPNERNRVRKGDSPKRIHRKGGRVWRCITATNVAAFVAVLQQIPARFVRVNRCTPVIASSSSSSRFVRVNRCTPVIVAALIDYWLRTNDHRNNPE